METAENVGKITWETMKFIFELVSNNLPLFLMWIAIGFIVGIIGGIIVIKLARRKGVFSTVSKSAFTKFLNKAYPVLMFLSFLFLSLTFFTYIGMDKVVKKEIRHGVSSTFEFVEQHVLTEETTRKKIYDMTALAIEGGTYVKSFNHAVAEVAADIANEEQDNGFLMSKLTDFVVIDKVEDKLVEYEKGLLYFAAAKLAEKTGLGEHVIGNYESFETAFDKWLDSDFKIAVGGISAVVTDFIYKHIQPFVFSIFLPFLIVGFIVFAIPIIHYLLGRRKSKIALEGYDPIEDKLIDDGKKEIGDGAAVRIDDEDRLLE